MTERGRLGLLAGLALALTPTAAHAGNDDGVLLGNEAVLTGGALTASVDDGSATWFNPAGLALVTRDSIDVSGNAYQLRFLDTPGILRSADGARADGHGIDFLAVPSALTLVRRLDSSTTFGLGVFVPALAAHDDRVSLVESLPGGQAQWRLHEYLMTQRYVGGLCLGFRLAENLRFGIGLFGSYDNVAGTAELLGAVTGAGGAPILAVAATDAISAQSIAFALAAGVQWEPVPGLLLGLAAQSPYVSVGSLYGSASTVLLTTPGTIDFTPEDVNTLEPRLDVAAPARVRLGVAFRLPSGILSIDGDLQHELSSPALGVDRTTIGNVRLGGRFRIDDTFSIGGGLFTDLAANRVTEFGRPRVSYVGASLGLEIRSRHRLGAGEHAADIVFVQTFGLRYAYGFGSTGGIRFDIAGGTALSTIAVASTTHELGLHVGSGVYY